MQNCQHHHRLVSDEVKNAVLENRKIHAADVGKAHGIQKALAGNVSKHS